MGSLPEARKYTCRFMIGIENEDGFRVVRRIIGSNGAKMKEIVARSGGDAKLRLRGRGSGYVERDTKAESREPLQLCISCPRPEGYRIAMQDCEALLRAIYDEYARWRWQQGTGLPGVPQIHMTERHHAATEDSPRNRGAWNAGEGTGGGAPRRRGGARNRRGGKSAAGGGSGGQQPPPPQALDEEPKAPVAADRGVPPAGAPGGDEIERLIEDRNQARRRGDFAQADRIRNGLRDRGVVLSDEKGGHGNAATVTSWRYWQP